MSREFRPARNSDARRAPINPVSLPSHSEHRLTLFEPRAPVGGRSGSRARAEFEGLGGIVVMTKFIAALRINNND